MHVIEDPLKLEGRRGTIYPDDLAAGFERRVKRMLTAALGLTQFGINMTTLEPGAQSSHRHWHASEDECIFVLDGELWLVTDQGEKLLGAGMAAGFPAGEPIGHHLVNRGDRPATYLEIGTRAPDETVQYSEVDLRFERRGGVNQLLHKSGEPYP